MLKVWILTLLIEGLDRGALVAVKYNYTSQKECEVAALHQKKTLENKPRIHSVSSSCFIGYVVK